ncbi:glycosyl hydrolase, partial [Nostoc sp. 3335mG]
HYLLTYSDGKTTTDTYKVRYAIGDTPFGPFREGPGSPILSTDAGRQIISPGHHAVFRSGGQPYILYHRHGLPFPPPGDVALRQVAVDPLTIRPDGRIAPVVPGHGGPVNGFAARRDAGLRWRASGQGSDALHGPERAADDNYATWWSPAGEAPVLTADLGAVRPVKGSALRMRFPTHRYTLSVEGSRDGRTWRKLAEANDATGSPIELSHPTAVRYLRLRVPADAGVWEWTLR